MRVKNNWGNYGFSEWWLGGNADGKKPIMSLTAGGSTSAGEAQDGILTLYSTTSAWAANTWSPTNNTAKVVLDAGGDSYFNGGNVGIGVTDPADLLEIKGTNAVMRLDASASGSGVAWIKFDDQGTSKWALGLSKNSSLSGADFHIYEDAGSANPRFTVKDGGNVGIGVSDPAEKLEVAGSILIDYALAHRGDSNNKIIFTTDIQTFQTNGTDRLTIASDGDVTVAGAFYATTKEFLIDHPTKPDMKLHHGSLEGPEHGVYIRGKSSSSTVELPEYWTGLVDEDSITVQVTPIGKSQELYVKSVSGREVKIGTDIFGQRLNFFYFIQAERKDVDKLVVEV